MQRATVELHCREEYGGVLSLNTVGGAYLLAIADEHAEPGAHFAVGAQQQAADVGHQGADRFVRRVQLVVQGEGHAQAWEVALLHLEDTHTRTHTHTGLSELDTHLSSGEQWFYLFLFFTRTHTLSALTELGWSVCVCVCVCVLLEVIKWEVDCGLTTMALMLRASEGFIWHSCLRASVRRRPPWLSSSWSSPFLIRPRQTGGGKTTMLPLRLRSQYSLPSHYKHRTDYDG